MFTHIILQLDRIVLVLSIRLPRESRMDMLDADVCCSVSPEMFRSSCCSPQQAHSVIRIPWSSRRCSEGRWLVRCRARCGARSGAAGAADWGRLGRVPHLYGCRAGSRHHRLRPRTLLPRVHHQRPHTPGTPTHHQLVHRHIKIASAPLDPRLMGMLYSSLKLMR